MLKLALRLGLDLGEAGKDRADGVVSELACHASQVCPKPRVRQAGERRRNRVAAGRGAYPRLAKETP